MWSVSNIFCVLIVLQSFDAGCFTLNVFLCRVTVTVLWLFLTVRWVGLQCVNVIFSDQTHFSDQYSSVYEK